jgi:hypothetical protein
MATSSEVTLLSFSNLLSIKLDRNSYPLWLSQFLPILRSKKLMGFVDGTKPCPEKFAVKDGVRSSDISPAYENWVEQDQTILSWINATLTPPILSTVARLFTSRTVWLSLEKRYASQSRTRILQLKNQL